MGRRIKMKPECPTENSWCGDTDKTYAPATNSRLLVSIAQAFGQEIDKFGTQPDPALVTGTISELV
jgi:hypothetical protein